MTDPSAPRSLNCPNCGAPLDFPPGETSVRCRFCDSSIERSHSDLTPDDDAHVIQIDPAVFSGTSVSNPARRFVLKMRNGQPVMIEVGPQPAPALGRETGPAGTFDLERARRVAAASDEMLARSRQRGQRAAAPPSRSSPVGCLLTLAAIVGVVVLIAAVVFLSDPKLRLVAQQLLAGHFDEAFATSSTLGANVLLTESDLLIPGANNGPDQAILLTYQIFDGNKPDEYRVQAVDTATRKLLWQSDPLGPDLYTTRILYDADRLYVIGNPNLVALNRSDGSTAWSAPLADKIELGLCLDCLQLVDGRLAAFSDDGTLAVYDAATGEEQWTVTADQDSPRGLYVLGGRLAFMDRNDDVQGVLRTFDPATGEEKAAHPTCTTSNDYEEHADWTTRLLATPDGDGVYMAYGSSPPCFQRWDVGTLTLDWSTELPSNFSSSLDALAPVLTGDTLYLAARTQVLALGTQDGALTTLVEDEDYDFFIEAVHGDDLVLLARRSRGTTRYALWDIDPTIGDQRWAFDLGDNEPLEPGDIINTASPEWLVEPTDAGLRLVRFQSAEDDQSHAILNEVLDWQTGESGGQTTTVLGLPTIIFDGPNWQAWRGDTLWMVIENTLMAFDAANNKVVSRWP